MKTHIVTRIVNIKDLEPYLDDQGRLHLNLPAIDIEGPLFSPEAVTAFTECGFTGNEIDDLSEQVYNKIMAKILGKLFAERLM